MAAYTSAGSGYWRVAGSWTSAPPTGGPGAGDTVHVVDGHTITVDATSGAGGDGQVTIGTDSGTAIEMDGTSKLSIADGCKILCRGNMVCDANVAGTQTLELQAGGSFFFDPPNSSTQWKWTLYGVFGSGHSVLSSTATSGNHSHFGTDLTRASNNTAANCYIDDSNSGPGLSSINISYCDVSNLGTASKIGLLVNLRDNDAVVHGCTFTGSNISINTPGGSWDSNLTFTSNVFTSSIADGTWGSCAIFAISTTASTGTRTISGNDFDITASYVAQVSTGIDHNVFRGSAANAKPFNVYGAATWTAFDSNLLYGINSQGDVVVNMAGQISNNYAIVDGGNPHYFTNIAGLAGTVAFHGNIFDPRTGGASDQGDCLITQDPSSPLTLNIYNNIVLYDHGSGYSSTLITHSGTTNLTLNITHNTCRAPSVFSEGTNCAAGSIALYKANLHWYASLVGGNYILSDSSHQTSGGTADVCSPANANYNAKYHVDVEPVAGTTYQYGGGSVPSDHHGYQGNFSSVPGANDLADTDPQFVASTRNMTAWGATVGQSTFADTLTYIAADPTNRIPAMMAWVRAGFVPQNTALNTTFGGDSSSADANGTSWTSGTRWIGAMQGPTSAPSSSVVPILIMTMGGN